VRDGELTGPGLSGFRKLLRPLGLARVSLIGLIAVVALPGVAAAAPAGSGPATISPGVHVDPGSPAAKEYAVPLGQARGGRGGTVFGAGITPTGGGPGSPPPSANTGSQQPSRPGGAAGSPSRGRGVVRGSRRTPRSGGPGVVASRELPSPRAGGGNPLGWMLASALLVLVLGSAGAAIIQRRTRKRVRTSG